MLPSSSEYQPRCWNTLKENLHFTVKRSQLWVSKYAIMRYQTLQGNITYEIYTRARLSPWQNCTVYTWHWTNKVNVQLNSNLALNIHCLLDLCSCFLKTNHRKCLNICTHTDLLACKPTQPTHIHTIHTYLYPWTFGFFPRKSMKVLKGSTLNFPYLKHRYVF